jgi:DNA-binding NarL/FixJ family response regulator
MIETLAWIAADQEAPARAARLIATAESVWALIGTTLAAFGPPLLVHHERCERRVRTALGAAGMHREREHGRYPTVEAAIASILDRPGPASSSPGAPAGTTGPLSSREHQIAELLARGLSNRAIAAQLVISQRTVDGHVERILAKLGFSARTQAAAWCAARVAGPPAS